MYLLAEISCIQVIIEITCLSKSFHCLGSIDQGGYNRLKPLVKTGGGFDRPTLLTNFVARLCTFSIAEYRQRESIIGVQWGQGNPNSRVHHSSGKLGFAEFPTGTVDPRVGISWFHCTQMINSISHISNKE